MKRPIHNLLRDRKGATAIEYGLIVSLIVVVLIGALNGLASTTVGLWNDVADNVVQAS